MNFEITKSPIDGKLTFRGEITRKDLESLRLDGFDRMLISEEPESAADVLLQLETIFRRAQEQGKPTSAACSRCHTAEGDCDALVSDDPTACPCRCHESEEGARR